ncbi:MAG: 2-oxo acid dehydrogenase subunit E2 [Thermoplasmata archaeon]|nr:2-oxo acid dehydrogenase subunit E2 [Thermoplasmata archaeon]
MVYEFRLPDIGEGVAEGEVVQWFVKEGEVVQEDAPLVSVLTDKANVEIPSPKAGKVLRIHAQVGEKVKVGGLLVTIDAEGLGPGTPVAAAPSTDAAAPSASPPGPPADLSPPPRPAGAPSLAAPSVRRLAAEKGIDLTTIRGSGPGGRIVETDLVRPAAAPSAVAPPVAVPATPAPPIPPSSPLATTKGAGAPIPPGPPAAPTAPAAPPNPEDGERIPIRGVRRIIAEHMAEATHKAAHFTYVEEVDVGELMRVRDRMARSIEKDGLKLSYLPFIVKAVVAGLRAHPWMNARMDDERQELVLQKGYHIGIATAAPEGLIVPVLRNAETKSVAHLAREIADLSERGRAGKLQRAELIHGSFTITSLGALGGVLATPILNYPEVAILGVHRIFKRPGYLADGTIGPVHSMNLSVSLDHRVLDGIVGAQFLAVVKANLEDPSQMFAHFT